jgi:hypothetical protein
MTAVTQWFKGSSGLKPARSGVYQVLMSGRIRYAHYSITRGWGYAGITARIANADRNPFGAIQGKTWRGLAEEPK